MKFHDKVILITGGTSGIGAACVKQFAKKGAIVVFCSNDRETGLSLLNELGNNLLQFVFCDVRVESEIKSLVDNIEKKYEGKLDCLVNNVGTHPENRKIDDFSSVDLEKLFEINVRSYFLFSKFCLPLLRNNKGCIVNISSNVALLGQKYGVTYSMTKGAITSMTKSLALDEASNGVRVNCISPGIIDTPLLRQNTVDNVKLNNGSFENEIDKMKTLIPLGKIGTTDDVANVCLFLASNKAQYITGSDILVTGGSEIGYGVKYSDS